MTNVEVNQATLRLRAPVMIGWHLHLADTIKLLAQACRGDSDGQIEDFWNGLGSHGKILKRKLETK
jgi:hypothetical protein